MRVFIDPGHGGKDPGAVRDGVHESEVVLAVGLMAEDLLTTAGLEVIMSRRTDVHVGLHERARMANEVQADLFVSIHLNAHTSDATGTETWIRPGDDKSREFAASLNPWMVRAINTRCRGVKEKRFVVLRETRMTATLLEVGFLSGPGKAALLALPETQGRIATALSFGILGWIVRESRRI